MKRSIFLQSQIFIGLIVLSALLVATFGSANASTTQLSDPPSDQVVVKLKPGVAIDAILTRYHATLLGMISETNLYFLQLPAGQTADQVLPGLNADQDLFYAEPNYYSDGSPGGGAILFRAHMAPLAEAILFRAHADPLTPSGQPDQWAWNKIGLVDAQKISVGQGVVVAVLDTGLAADHPLVRSSILAGYDFVGMKNAIYDTGNNLDDDNDGQVDEDFGHGTHVSGIILTGAPGVQIMPIRVLNSDGVGTYWEVAAGIRFAVDHGADIINMSLSAPRLTPSLIEALDYAASRGVIVIAAAGNGPGPNFPAGYAAQPFVIGVGATDQNDGIAWFSGGHTADTDIFAPGVDIYSAFPYNNFALGSGTSMSAPMVSAEAALLMSRYPDWGPAQVIERIFEKTLPVPNASVGRVDLSSALNTGTQVSYIAGDNGTTNDGNIKPHIRLINNTPEDIPLSELKIRYWYTVDTDQAQTFHCDYALFGCANLTGAFTRLPDGSSNKTATSDTFIEIGFTSNPGNLPGGGQGDMYLRINKNDWSDYNEVNDYAYNGSLTAFAPWENITVYRNGALIAGLEPIATTSTMPPPNPTQTQTPIPPTHTAIIIPATATRTNTPAPSPTATSAPATATRTNTPNPSPTATFTRTSTPALPTATHTPTPAPATNTKTSTPQAATPTAQAGVASVKLQYKANSTASNSPSISPHLILFNTGATGIPLSEIKIRYWFTVDGDKPQNYWCDYAGLGCGNITSQFVYLASPRTGADYYLEIGFISGAGILAPGANTGQIQGRFSKNDWSAYTQTGDHSFDPLKTQFADWTKISVYRIGILGLGIEP